MEEDIKLLEKLEFIGYGKKEDIEALGRDEHVDTTTIIKNLINKYKEQEKIIDFMIEWIRARSIYAVDSHEKLKDYFKKKARDENV